MSLEDLRDNYKTLRSSKRNIKLNGATYRQKLDDMGEKALIKKINHNHSNPHEYDEVEYLNEKYGLNVSNFDYSLNKKKRWELVQNLKRNINEFNEEDLDIRVYETELSTKTAPRLVNLERSKGDKIQIKKTYANLNSIKQQERLAIIEKLTPKAPPVKKINRFKVKNFIKDTNKLPERIVINDQHGSHENEIDEDNIEYEIKYEPKNRIIKYGPNLDRDPIFNKKNFKKKISISDDDTLRHNSDFIEYDYEEQSEEEQSDDSRESSIEITLNELIENFSKTFLNKHENKIKKFINTSQEEFKDKKIYIDRQISFRENQTNILVPEFCEPIKVSLEIFNNTTKKDQLKEKYGLTYNEGIEYSPRRFNLNLSDQVKTNLINKIYVNKLDLIVWLRFQQVLELDETSFYDVSICANLIDRRSISLDNLNPCQPYELEAIVKKTIELITNLPNESFKQNTETKILKSEKVEKLPTIGGNLTQVKSLEELKLEMINNNKFQRTNSIEVVKEMNTKITDSNYTDNKIECVLCFEEKNSSNECTFLTKCNHCVCNSCMKYYVDSRLVNSLANAGKFPCPSCSNELELALLINFASNATLLDVYLKLTVEKVWFVLNNYKWCQANCSNILKIDMESSPYGTVSCSCGYKMCLKCNNPPHFPLSCQNSTNYYKELNKLGPLVTQDLQSNDNMFYSSHGKRCPKCSTYMEKDYGCNQMYCTQCNTYFCWNCVRTWDEHLKLNNGAHFCKEKEEKNFITVDFISKQKQTKKKSKSKVFEDSLYHRNMRSSISVKKYSNLIQNLIDTIDFENVYENPTQLSKTENLVQNLKEINKKRTEIKTFLNEMVAFVNELHFICEHGLVLLRDKNLTSYTRSSISLVIRKLEVLIWRIKYILEYGNGMKSVDEIKLAYNNGIKLINILNNLKS